MLLAHGAPDRQAVAATLPDKHTRVLAGGKVLSQDERDMQRQKRRCARQAVLTEDLVERAQTFNPSITRLQMSTVKVPTMESYLATLHRFVSTLRLSTLDGFSPAQLDQKVQAFLEIAYRDGVFSGIARRLMAAVLWILTRTGPMRSVLPRSHQTATGWSKLEPQKSRPPVPYEVMMRVCRQLAMAGKIFHAVAIWLAFETYLRSCEVLSLKTYQIVLALKDKVAGSQAGLGYTTILASAQEDGMPNKVGEYDLSIPLDLPRQQILADILECRTLGNDETALVSDFPYQNLADAFRRAATISKVHALEPSLHGLRHGGASHDRRTGDRLLLGVQQRGNWRSFNTVRRYEKSGRVLLQLRKLPASVLKEIRAQAPHTPEFLLKCFNQQSPRPPLVTAASSSNSSMVQVRSESSLGSLALVCSR